MITLLVFMVVFSVIIFAHEFGHFIVGKLARVRVDEFGFGYPPRLFTIGTWGGTTYTINVIPIGGFVKMGEDDPSRPDSLASKSMGIRALAFFAGSFMNLVLAIICYIVVALLGQQYLVGQVVIEEIVPDSPAAMAQLQVGDEIVAINDHIVQNNWDLRQATQMAAGEKVSLTVRRNGERLTVSLVPRTQYPAGQGPMGVTIGLRNPKAVTIRYSIWEAIPISLQRSWQTLTLIVEGIAGMIRGTIPPDVTGPIGLFQVTGEVARSGFSNLLELMALISINLFLVNLLPFPPLDGGHLLFIALEALRGKRIEPQREGLVHFVGMVILLILMLLISYQDLLRLIRGDSVLP